MYKKAATYFFLVLFAALALANLIPIGDYSSGMANGLLMLLFSALFIVSFLIVIVINIYKKTRFDWIPVGIFGVFALFFTLTIQSEGGKFWTSVVLEANTDNQHNPHDGRLVLYENHSFTGTEVFTDFSMSYSGNYRINNDTLYLDREDLPEKTGGLLTTKYYIDSKNRLIPADTLYKPLIIKK
ncbi:hypothetical protein AM493_02750 [Flavobacterium akiainvivens]|uniref:Uncharacterized protein n=1 Tax=Flavobacterium akiainvivens TaxID=1202724 RepID=A0A0N0RQG6_9FLAO|nr:hypothetical protein [Flavobacterium akiainvivens]KOS05072.1 hypothetical protein AM493_02750 [Flavobacterium akiainvivens]SFQ51932.1 hypothetical protein SAMN05444144_106254 [Flavobacterium akiainvivens]